MSYINQKEKENKKDEGRSVSRRTYLKGVGVASTLSGVGLSATAPASASTTGYGEGGYGEGGYGGTDDRPELAIRTDTATDVSDTGATLRGELVTMDGIDDCSVWFEFRTAGDDHWESTTGTTRTSKGTFEERVSGLPTDTNHEFRAVAEHDDEELRDAGDVLSFETKRSDANPEINRLRIAEVSPPNPHADIELEWEVSHRDGLLESLLIYIEATDGSATTTLRESVAGETASGGETVRISHGEGTTYTVTLIVTDTNGEHASRTETLNA